MAGHHFVMMRASLLLLTITLICLIQSVHSAPLSSYLVSSFSSPGASLPFNHITINNFTGDVYIGARERLYQLNSDLTVKHIVDTGKCPSTSGNINNNKLLAVAPSPEDKLITCGGCDGFCETRDLTNISHDVVRYENDEEKVVTTADLSTFGVVAMGAEIGNEYGGFYLFTAVSYDSIHGSGNLPFISKRSLVADFPFSVIQRVQQPDNAMQNLFKHTIAYMKYLYFFIFREGSAHLYLGRLCRSSLDEDFASYTEIELQCGSLNMIQSAHIGQAGSQLAESWSINSTDDILYVVFLSGNSSALCIYMMGDVQQSFEGVTLGCIRGTTNKGTINMYLQDSKCNTLTSELPDSVLCTAFFSDDGVEDTHYRYASGTNPLSASPVITIPGIEPTSIVTTIERNHTVAFMGDTQGHLHKLNIVNNSFGYVYETVPLGSGSVLQEMFLNESTKQLTLALATDSEPGSMVLNLDIVNCSQYQSCEECIGEDGENDGDPYCGWCILEARCTRYEACPFFDESTRWLSYNALQCVSISDIQPNGLPYHQTEQEITITVQQLPELKDTQYKCAFDSYEVSANTAGNSVTCTSPPANAVPPIPRGSDHVTLTLSIISIETDIRFVSKDFIIFNCAVVTSCSSCVTRPWSCDWCVYDNRCTDNSRSCVLDEDTVVIGHNKPLGSENQEQELCPQLLGTTEPFLIPVSIASGYSLSAKNLPTDQSKVESYECILHIDGKEVRVSSIFFNDTYILCRDEQYMYGENILQKNVSVSVQWNGKNSIDELSETYVTLYKCSVNNASCSRCLSKEATPPILECGWCGDDCNVIQSDVCWKKFLRQNETQSCSAPVITDFYPLSGPINGETRLEITGTDLGVQFNDILQILIQDLECDLTDMGMYYQPGQSVSCMTGIATKNTSGRIHITVWSSEENKTGESTEEFHYRNPMITAFYPMEGPVAGGTHITIIGMYLDTGRNISARFGDAECVEISLQDTVATCITSNIPENVEVPVTLTMTFDGVKKRFMDYTFTYMPNPRIDDVDRTKSIMSGGTEIQLTGERFDLIQEPKVVVTSLTTNASNSELCNGTDTVLICPTPSFPEDVISVRKRRATNGAMRTNLTFDFDRFIIEWGILEYYPDPMYESFSGPNRIYKSDNKRLEITGMNLNLASREDDVQVLLGPDGVCDVDDIEISVLRCQLPDQKPRSGNINGTVEQGPTEDLPAVTILHGNLMFYPGYVQYSTTSINIGAIVGAVVGAVCGSGVLIFIIGVLFFRRNHDRLNRQVQQFELLEKKIQRRVETAFHELQADMSEVEEQISHLGVPFVNAQDYSKNMLFAGLAILPPTSDPEYLNSDLEKAMIMFSRQLGNSDFLARFIQQLEEQRQSHRRDRVNIASLITVLLVTEGKFGYFTETLFKLLEENIEEGAESGRAKSLFRRTETIVEKLLSNWITLSMYHFLKRHVAESLYLLYQSIKIQVEKGPIDITTGQSVFSLNFECLLEEDVEFNELTLSVVGSNRQHQYYVKVLDIDCITQVKQKILDAAYRRSHIVQQNRAHEMDLLWYHPGGEERILKDRDEFNKTIGNTKDLYINTIKNYGVEDGSQVALILKAVNDNGIYQPVTPGVQLFQAYLDHTGPDDVRDRDYTRIRTLAADGSRIIHLVSEDQMPTSGSGKIMTKLDREFLAPRLLVTKKTIQQRLDEFLAGVFKKPDETPRTIKHLFDFFDKMAEKYCTDKPEEIAEAWKSNSVPLRYWMTTLTHPSYIFDMRQSRSADQSVSVLANMLDNACKKIRRENSQVADLNRVLFFKELPGYIRTIDEYYKSISSLPPSTTEELQENFHQITQEFAGLFSRVGTLKSLYDFTCQDTADLLDSITELMPN